MSSLRSLLVEFCDLHVKLCFDMSIFNCKFSGSYSHHILYSLKTIHYTHLDLLNHIYIYIYIYEFCSKAQEFVMHGQQVYLFT